MLEWYLQLWQYSFVSQRLKSIIHDFMLQDLQSKTSTAPQTGIYACNYKNKMCICIVLW
jgi:hypothetical protein